MQSQNKSHILETSIIETSISQEKSNEDMKDKAYGSVYGAFIGDAAGGYLEFWRGGEITKETIDYAMELNGGGVFQLQPGQVTDDSEMAMCIVHALYKGNQTLILHELSRYFGIWYQSMPFDIGTTTSSALSAIDTDNLDARMSYVQTSKINSLSNGCLMRKTPLAVWGYKLNKQDLYAAVKLETAFTHSRELAIGACYLYCYAIGQLIQGKAAKEVFEEVLDESAKFDQWSDYAENGKCLRQYLEEAKGHARNLHNPMDNMGFLKIAFQWAFHYLYHDVSYHDAQWDILNRGGDTDTNAAIIGGLLGARDGKERLNQNQVKKVLDCFSDPEVYNNVKDFRVNFDLFVPRLHIAESSKINKLESIFQNAPDKLAVINQSVAYGANLCLTELMPGWEHASI
ncbi:hypothetical protein FGO68_gene2351 [Halteria grandinella]|uniref:ADP-ribosylglycohydrolase n=1 Tax=Halteria grandinella TaxID=5974 RepID=A0A8J8NQL9_HALGN|nr:hypothetical protein FGO68_gene2351 [Halteria grandinella]